MISESNLYEIFGFLPTKKGCPNFVDPEILLTVRECGTQKTVSTCIVDEEDVDYPVFPNLQFGGASGSIRPV